MQFHQVGSVGIFRNNLSKTFPNEPHWAGWGVTELTSRAPFCFLHLPLQNTSLESIFPLTVDLPSGIDVLGMVNARIWVASMDPIGDVTSYGNSHQCRRRHIDRHGIVSSISSGTLPDRI